MREIILFDAVSSSLIAFLVLVLLVFVLMALRRERLSGEAPRGLVPFIIVVLGLCVFVSLSKAYFRVKKQVEPQRISERVPQV